MIQKLLALMIALLLVSLGTAAFAQQTGKAGKYTVTLVSVPTPIVAGDNNFTITVKDGEKPLVGAR